MPDEAASPHGGLDRLALDAAECADRVFDRVAKELRNARALGQMTVTFGSSQVSRRMRPQSRAGSEAERTSSPSPAEQSTASDHGAIDDLIPGYDDLSASQVIGLLEDLESSELARVADHEQRGRGRRTILGRIAQLQEPSA